MTVPAVLFTSVTAPADNATTVRSADLDVKGAEPCRDLSRSGRGAGEIRGTGEADVIV